MTISTGAKPDIVLIGAGVMSATLVDAPSK